MPVWGRVIGWEVISGVWFGVCFRSCSGARGAQPHKAEKQGWVGFSVEFRGGMFYLDFGLTFFAFP